VGEFLWVNLWAKAALTFEAHMAGESGVRRSSRIQFRIWRETPRRLIAGGGARVELT